MLPWEQGHLPSSKTTSLFQFWASLSPAAATGAPSSPRQSRCLTCLHYRGRDLSSLNQSIFSSAAALPSARERISWCVLLLRIPGMPLAFSYYLWTGTKSHTNSVTVCISMTEMLWRHYLHPSFIQAEVKSRVTDTWYCIMMTTSTSLSMEIKVQEKNPWHTLRYTFNFLFASLKRSSFQDQCLDNILEKHASKKQLSIAGRQRLNKIKVNT